jgi:hypothetical protein
MHLREFLRWLRFIQLDKARHRQCRDHSNLRSETAADIAHGAGLGRAGARAAPFCARWCQTWLELRPGFGHPNS